MSINDLTGHVSTRLFVVNHKRRGTGDADHSRTKNHSEELCTLEHLDFKEEEEKEEEGEQQQQQHQLLATRTIKRRVGQD